MYNPSLRVHLIDTPGFNDTYLSDTEVLRTLASWLSQSFKSGIRLSGIIYMHRISDIGFRGSAMKNLIMFKKLCGESAYPSVALTTSMWNMVSEEDGIKREQKLQDEPDYWGSMIMKGSRVFRYLNTYQSALEVVGYIVSRHSSVVLDIQDELVHKLYDFHETSAAQQLDGGLLARRKRYEMQYKGLKEEAIAEIDMEHKMRYKELKEEAIAERGKSLRRALDDRIDTEHMMLNQVVIAYHKRYETEYKELVEQIQDNWRALDDVAQRLQADICKVDMEEHMMLNQLAIAHRKRYETEFKELVEQIQDNWRALDDVAQRLQADIRRVDSEHMMLNQPLEALEKRMTAEFKGIRDRRLEELQRYKTFVLKCQKAKQERQEEVGRRNSGKFASCFYYCDLAIRL
jgi:hypothetical protein